MDTHRRQGRQGNRKSTKLLNSPKAEQGAQKEKKNSKWQKSMKSS